MSRIKEARRMMEEAQRLLAEEHADITRHGATPARKKHADYLADILGGLGLAIDQFTTAARFYGIAEVK